MTRGVTHESSVAQRRRAVWRGTGMWRQRTAAAAWQRSTPNRSSGNSAEQLERAVRLGGANGGAKSGVTRDNAMWAKGGLTARGHCAAGVMGWAMVVQATLW